MYRENMARMNIEDLLLKQINPGEIANVCIGIRWTAVVSLVDGKRKCGLASTLQTQNKHSARPLVEKAGLLAESDSYELARYILSSNTLERSIGLAAINSLLPDSIRDSVKLNAEHEIARLGRQKKVVLVGHFPFVQRLRADVGELFVLEREPQAGDYPEKDAPLIVPQADIVAITSLTITNASFSRIVALCSSSAHVMLLGPSTPLSPALFDHGITTLSGAIVDDIDSVLKGVNQGANFKQLHKLGVRLVTIRN
jgi:uncharacterized protein (DUF4213/DUF364 family)